MLYYLFQYLDHLDIPGAGVFKYVSFRSSMALILSMIISTMIGKRIIERLQLLQIGEVVRDLPIEGQLSKKGTPTMGGIIIILSIIIPCLLLGRLDNIYLILMLITTVWCGIIGFWDDYIKVFKKDKDGLKGRFKIVGQIGLGLIVGVVLYVNSDVVIRENKEHRSGAVIEKVSYPHAEAKSTKTTIPFVKNNNFDYKSLVSFMGDKAQDYGWIIYVIVVIFIVTAVSNSANLNDGMDGMATGNTAIIGVTLGILAYVSSHIEYAGYLNILYLPGTEELTVFAAAFIGATIGFLWYNAFPAQVFMGDTGSLALGGIIAVFAIIIRKELMIPLLCGLFFLESLSVILQVGYFKRSKKKYGQGRRVFKMTPIHHHFQVPAGKVQALLQYPNQAVPESKVVIRFWIVQIILAVLTVVTLKLR